jgi:hypothetical protein
MAETQYYLMDRRKLGRVEEHVFGPAYLFTDGVWRRSYSLARHVTGIGGDSDFEKISEAEARHRFPDAFPH